MLTIEACNDGTITRACARTLNRALAAALPATDSRLGYIADLSGTTPVELVARFLDAHGLAYRVVAAASLTGADKARHTREVTRSRKAQTARVARKAEAAAARRPMPFPRSA